MIESVLIAGAGAVGLTVADTLCASGVRTAVLAGGERLERYRKKGLVVNGRQIRPDLIAPAENAPSPFDLIIIACKNHHLSRVISDIENFVGGETIIVSLLNGITSEESVGAVYGRERLPLAMILGTDAQHIAASSAGSEVRYSRKGVIHFGPAAAAKTERDRELEAFFGRVSLPAEFHEADMLRMLWFKFMVNCGANQVSGLLRLPYGAFKREGALANENARALLENAMREVIAVSNAEGIGGGENPLGGADIEAWETTLANLDDSGYTSMAQDIIAERKTEIELFGPVVSDYGKKHGIATPVNATLALAIRAVEKGYEK